MGKYCNGPKIGVGNRRMACTLTNSSTFSRLALAYSHLWRTSLVWNMRKSGSSCSFTRGAELLAIRQYFPRSPDWQSVPRTVWQKADKTIKLIIFQNVRHRSNNPGVKQFRSFLSPSFLFRRRPKNTYSTLLTTRRSTLPFLSICDELSACVRITQVHHGGWALPSKNCSWYKSSVQVTSNHHLSSAHFNQHFHFQWLLQPPFLTCSCLTSVWTRTTSSTSTWTPTSRDEDQTVWSTSTLREDGSSPEKASHSSLLLSTTSKDLTTLRYQSETSRKNQSTPLEWSDGPTHLLRLRRNQKSRRRCQRSLFFSHQSLWRMKCHQAQEKLSHIALLVTVRTSSFKNS